MEPYYSREFANPSGSHAAARRARRAVDDAREVLSSVLDCEPAEIIFTSGGTEADNLAITGAALNAVANGAARAIPCCSAVEHPAVLEPVRFLGGLEVPVGREGVLELEALAGILKMQAADIVVVSVMLANNETGVIEPLEEAASLARELVPGVLIHTDAVQALRWLDVGTAAAPADLVTVTAHKIGGPKGIGALVARHGARSRIAPLLRGGPQERELRAGTLNVPGIVGFAAAARMAQTEREDACRRVRHLADELADGIRQLPGATFAVESAPRLPGTLNVGFSGIASEEMLLVLDQLGVAASAGSSCASGALEPSPVLVAMGMSTAEAKTHVRFSLGRETTSDDIAGALEAIQAAVTRLSA